MFCLSLLITSRSLEIYWTQHTSVLQRLSFVEESATHRSTYKLITSNQTPAHHDTVRNVITDFKAHLCLQDVYERKNGKDVLNLVVGDLQS